MKSRQLLIASLLAVWAMTTHATTITIQVMDAAGEGFRDNTPFTPIGGNNATTVGQARLNVFNEAARVWGLLLNSAISIAVEARFDALSCAATTATLGSAGTVSVFRDFPGAAVAGVWYPGALANALSVQDLDPGAADIRATFSSTINGNSACLGGGYLYLGFDHNLTPRNGQTFVADLLPIVLHELAHGFGFVSVVDENGSGITSGGVNRLSIFDQFVYDESVNMFWRQMDVTQRKASTLRDGSVVWNGANINNNVSRMSAGVSGAGHLLLYAPITWDDGSSISHWDDAATPNLLMEWRATATLGSRVDMTTCALTDIGWVTTRCPDIINTAPVAMAANFSTNEDAPVSFTLQGSDTEGDALSYNIVTNPERGTLSGNGAAQTYTPSADLNGADSFTFRVSDGIDTSNVATVVVNVLPINDAPVALPQSVSTTTSTARSIVLTASDVDGNTLSYVVLTSPLNGTLSGTAPNLTYTPNTNFNGSDSFTFRANDGVLDSNTATVTVTVMTPASSGGGGGSLGGWWLVCLAALGLLAPVRSRRASRH